FSTTRSRLVLSGAAALHTEAALRSRQDGTLYLFHLDVATAIVEVGEAVELKPNTSWSIKPSFAAPVSNDFRILWYCTVIEVLMDTTRLGRAEAYLVHALALFPANTEIQFLAGVGKEM